MKRSLASFLGEKKDIVKNWRIIKLINDRANKQLDGKRSLLLEKNFQEILEIIYGEELDELNIWLDFGTLLGYYRDNNFIKHDIDMDLALIYDENNIKVLENFLLKNNFKKTKEFYYNDVLVELAFDYKGLNVDFIFYRKEKDIITTETIFFMTNAFGNPTRLEAYNYKIPCSSFRKEVFKNITVNIPENTEEYLLILYGENFKIPSNNYNWKNNPVYLKIDENKANVKVKALN